MSCVNSPGKRLRTHVRIEDDYRPAVRAPPALGGGLSVLSRSGPAAAGRHRGGDVRAPRRGRRHGTGRPPVRSGGRPARGARVSRRVTEPTGVHLSARTDPGPSGPGRTVRTRGLLDQPGAVAVVGSAGPPDRPRTSGRPRGRLHSLCRTVTPARPDEHASARPVLPSRLPLRASVARRRSAGRRRGRAGRRGDPVRLRARSHPPRPSPGRPGR